MESWLSLLLSIVFCSLSLAQDDQYLTFRTETLINNVVQDNQTGRIYVGAVNTIYQLSASLVREARTETGPKEDARTCTPPASACQDTKPMDNHNKLLLVHPLNGSLIVCGSRYKGICSLLNLSNVDQQIYYSDNKGERTYVASIEENVNVVGVMSVYMKEAHRFPVFVVGKGYGTQDSAKLISTRILQDFREWVVFENIIEASSVQTQSFVPKYLHDFRHAFKDDGFVYFLFSRTLDGTDNKNLTYISRLCENDHHYYSHTELQLNCGTDNEYNKVRTAYVANPGKELARRMSESGEYGNVVSWRKVLFVVASADDDPNKSALCMFPLDTINEKLRSIISACYIDSGKISGDPAVYIPYSSNKELCKSTIAVSGIYFSSIFCEPYDPCLIFKPKYALKVPAELKSGMLTAVSVAVENDHTIAFLGNSRGEVVKVSGHLETSNPARALVYHRAEQSHLYITTEKKVLPVQECSRQPNCQSCVGLKDPYCGWCVLEGRCTRRSECRRAEEKNGWLWSPDEKCVEIMSFFPPNLSCRKTETVRQTTWHHFGLRSGFYKPQMSWLMHVAADEARAAKWFLKMFTSSFPLIYSCDGGCCFFQGAKCPKFENPDPVLIPVGHKQHISFEGFNLDLYQVGPSVSVPYCGIYTTICIHDFHCFSVLIGVFYPFICAVVTLYNCAVGRQDCSLCKNADPKYRCVWCPKQKACVFEDLCSADIYNVECPEPEITDIIPKYGPLKGGIAITIRGSNMGIHRDDIVSITVVGEPCKHQKEKYSVSTSVVCEIGALPSRIPNWGQVEVEVKGGKKGTSSMVFTYQDPIPVSVKPKQGLKAGGTLITISGRTLETGSKNDVNINIGGVDCIVGGRNIVVTGSGFNLIQTALIKVQGDNSMALEVSVSSYFSHCLDRGFVLALDKCFSSSSQGRGFSRAMTAKEAQAFVGDVTCQVNTLQDDKLFLDPPSTAPSSRSRRHRRDTSAELLELLIKFGNGEWVVGSVQYEQKDHLALYIIIPAVIVPMLIIIAISVYCYRRKSQQAEREYEKVKHQLENLEESVRDRCKKEFTDLMIEMEDHTNDMSEGRIPLLDYKTYTDRVFFLPSKDGANDVMITGKLDIPEARRATVTQALNQFSNLLNSKTFLINFIRTLERSNDFNARAKVYFASLLTVALHGKLEYYTDIMRTLLLELMEEYVNSKNPKLMLRRSETVVERMLCNWMSICLYQFLKDSAGEPLYKLFRAIKHQIEKGPVDARVKKAKYTLNDTGLLGDDVEYSVLVRLVLVSFLSLWFRVCAGCPSSRKYPSCSEVKEKIIEQVYRNLPYSQRPKVDSVTLEWRPGSTGQILSDLDLTSQKEGRWRRINTLAHYNVRDNATLVLSRVLHTQQNYDQNHENHEERNALLEDDKVFHLVRPAEELDEIKSKRGSIKDKSMTKAITEIYLTRLLSVKGTLQQFVDDFFRSVLCSGAVVPPAVKYFFDFLDEQALKHNNVDEETIHIWKTNSLPLRFWVNILKNPHFIFDIHVTEVIDAALSVIAQTFMDACTKSEHKLSRDSPSNKLLYAKEISTYKKMVDDYYKGIRQMVPVSDQDMNTHLAEVSRSHTDKLNTQVALHQLYQYASKYYDGIIASLDEDPAAQSKQLTLRLQQIAAALENKVTDL
uniref:Plexin b2b n=1 Tax=Neogobius melanostomus TaxID=47308 RepID=A0A8C6WQD5_9GOBI